MTPKQRVVAAVSHRGPDRIPLDGSFHADVWEKLKRHFGTADAEGVMEKLGLDSRYPLVEPSLAFAEQAIPSPWPILDIGVGKQNLGILHDDGGFEDEYGVRRVPNSTGLYWLYSHHPLASAGLDEVRKYRFPDPRLEERYGSIRSDMARWKDKYFTVVEIPNIFKLSWELRGFERFMMDLSLDPRLAETLADRAFEHLVEASKQLVCCGIDMLMITGDIAMQEGMMVSPGMWRRYFKPRLRLWLKEIRRERDVRCMFHSDGNIMDVMEDLVEIGFDSITPIQPECMDVDTTQRRFGRRVCLHGTISCQRTLPFGTPGDVADEVRRRIIGCGKDGGLVLAPSNTVQPDVPLANILMLYETAQVFSLGPDDNEWD